MKEFVRFVENYGPIVARRKYEVINEGYDWVRVRYSGKSIIVPSLFIDKNNDYDADEMEYSLNEIDKQNNLIDEVYNV